MTKQELVNWLKTQAHQTGRLGKIGYKLKVLGFWCGSEDDMNFIVRAYKRYQKARAA